MFKKMYVICKLSVLYVQLYTIVYFTLDNSYDVLFHKMI